MSCKILAEYTVKHEGYVFMYVSNENPTLVDVYFDDVVMTYTPTNVLQYNEYYPFGLQTSNSWTRENSSNDFLYNGGSELNGTTTWYETFFRGYDPVLGRFNQIDPMAHASSSFTPYNYAFNDPVFFNDPNGDYPPGTIEKMWGGGHGLYGNGWGGAIGVGSPKHIYIGSGNNWADGKGYSDWSPHGGSDIYRMGLAMGLTDVGGVLYQIGADGLSRYLGEHNGQLGFWESYAEYDTRGYSGQTILPEFTAGLRFVPLAQQEGSGRFFTNEGDAYRYMWNSSFDDDGKVQQEVAAFLTSK